MDRRRYWEVSEGPLYSLRVGQSPRVSARGPKRFQAADNRTDLSVTGVTAVVADKLGTAIQVNSYGRG